MMSAKDTTNPELTAVMMEPSAPYAVIHDSTHAAHTQAQVARPIIVQPTKNSLHSSSTATQSIYNENRRPQNYPPTEIWRDGICDCFLNLWPSCGCVFLWNGAWILAQISQKTGFASFKMIVVPLMIIDVVCLIISVFAKSAGWVYFLPAIIVYIISILLRVHFVKKFRLDQHHIAFETMIAICCCPCSIAQMARHLYGYRKVCDGDTDPDVRNHYNEP